MGEVSTIGLDIAKSVFQVHGVDVAGVGCDPQARQSRKGAGVLWRAARRAWSGSKRVRQRIIGAASFKHWVTRLD